MRAILPLLTRLIVLPLLLLGGCQRHNNLDLLLTVHGVFHERLSFLPALEVSLVGSR
ncbi:MAG: hypothetical protein Q8M37_10630 [Nevskia sp.]|nr:hypothetical protein [Nevskia sp.]